MRHRNWITSKLARSLRMRVGVLVLAIAVLFAVFADLVASDAPLLVVGPRGVQVLPGELEPERYVGLSPPAIATQHANDFVVWPWIRCGPISDCGDGANVAPSWAHPLGTDSQGRDVAARLIHGAQSAFAVSFLVLLLSLLSGGVFGIAAGYVGGAWDELLARLAELIATFPTVVAVLLLGAVFPGLTIWSLALVVAAVRWAEVARLVRAEVVRVANEPFVKAARALGCTHRRIVWRHLMPQLFGPLIVSTLFGVASVMLTEAAVSFLGVGLEFSWGVMIAEGLSTTGQGGALVAAIGALGLTVGAAYLVADAVEENIDARAAGEIGAGRQLPKSQGLLGTSR